MKKFLLQLSPLFLAALLFTAARAESSAKPEGRSGSESPGEISWQRAITGEVAQFQAQLAELKRGHGDQHPEVVFIQRQLEAAEARAPWLLSFDFQGGRLADFLAMIAKAKVVSFNIISPEREDLNAELPPFSLRNAHLGMIVTVLGNLLEPRGYSLRPSESDPNSVVCVLARIPGAPSGKSQPPTEFSSFQLGDYLTDQQTVDVIVDALRTAWALDHEAAALRIKFHPATKILLVSGPAPAGRIAAQVIESLQKKPAPH